uniref:Uncharacterized protein n=1 Tax=Oryza barthii TaxID=65489 RepID=A0A0D3GCJ9_9ORYZ
MPVSLHLALVLLSMCEDIDTATATLIITHHLHTRAGGWRSRRARRDVRAPTAATRRAPWQGCGDSATKASTGGDEGGNGVALALGTDTSALVDLVGGAVTRARVAGVFLEETGGVVVSIVAGASGDGGIDVENDLLLCSNPAVSAPPPSSTHRRQWSSSPRTTAESPWLS